MALSRYSRWRVDRPVMGLPGGHILKRVIALAALILGTAAAFAVPASASNACIEIHLNVNGTAVDRVQCV